MLCASSPARLSPHPTAALTRRVLPDHSLVPPQVPRGRVHPAALLVRGLRPCICLRPWFARALCRWPHPLPCAHWQHAKHAHVVAHTHLSLCERVRPRSRRCLPLAAPRRYDGSHVCHRETYTQLVFEGDDAVPVGCFMEDTWSHTVMDRLRRDFEGASRAAWGSRCKRGVEGGGVERAGPSAAAREECPTLWAVLANQHAQRAHNQTAPPLPPPWAAGHCFEHSPGAGRGPFMNGSHTLFAHAPGGTGAQATLATTPGTCTSRPRATKSRSRATWTGRNIAPTRRARSWGGPP